MNIQAAAVTPEIAQRQRHVTPSDARAIAQLAASATHGLTDVVEAMHATIARPFGMARADDRNKTRGITGFVYKSIRGVTRVAATSVDVVLSRFTANSPLAGTSFERDAAISALNGMLGDYLVKTNNALAIPMSLQHEGKALDVTESESRAALASSRKLAIFVHGLCMNDRQWRRNGHDHGAQIFEALGYTPLRLRYNTGQHVSTNGAALAALLDAVISNWPTRIDEIVFIAHSMGGLVTRSALAQAAPQSSWRSAVRKAIFLGTPHHGAPLERGGRWIDIVLDAMPYTKPLARLGKIRSAGITDLRHGNIVERDWINDEFARKVTPLPSDVTCYAIAASTGTTQRDWRGVLIGDGLVPVQSALGHHRLAKHRLAFPAANTWIAYERNHMDLLSDPEVSARMIEWLRAD